MRGPPCRVCQSRRYHETDEGLLVCEFGHQRLNYIQTHDDDFGSAQIGREVRKRKKRKAQDDTQDVQPAFGENVRMLMCDAFQYLLKQQLAVLVDPDGFGFDHRLSDVVKWLWLVYAQSLDLTQGTVFERGQHDASSGQAGMDEPFTTETATTEQPDTSHDDDREVLTVVSLPPSDLAIEYTFIFCYLGAVFLRYPVVFGDLQRWALDGQLPYLLFVDQLPKGFHRRPLMPFKVASAMVPDVGELYEKTKQFLWFYDTQGIQFPGLNTAALLSRFMDGLGCPMAFYPMILQECKQVSMDFLPVGDASNEFTQRFLPCLRLLALCIIYIKLFYGSRNGVEYEQPLLLNNHEYRLPSLESWLAAAEHRLAQRGTKSKWFVSDLDQHSSCSGVDFAEHCRQVFFKRQTCGGKESEDFNHVFEAMQITPTASTGTETDPTAATPFTRQQVDHPACLEYYVYPRYPQPDTAGSIRFHSDYARLLDMASSIIGIASSQLQTVVHSCEQALLPDRFDIYKGFQPSS